jgi:alpha-tubulin suppressor-like RCC1 family protein
MTCVRHATGAVSCWGDNAFGSLGNGGSEDSAEPVTVQGMTDAVQLAAADHTVCARRQSGGVACWGSGFRGALGNGVDDNASSPVEVSRLTGVTAIAGSKRAFCAVHGGGRVSCWGANTDGQLGNGSVGNEDYSNTPVAVRDLRNVTKISMGGGTSCAVLADGSAQCWGSNRNGQTGHNNMRVEEVTTPWSVLNTNNDEVETYGSYIDIQCGASACCGLHETGRLSCSGSATYFEGRQGSPVPIDGFQLEGLGEPPAASSETADATPEQPPEPQVDNQTETEAEAAPPPAPTQQSPRARDQRSSCDCSNVRRECRLEYDETARPHEICECEPACCCRGGRRR